MISVVKWWSTSCLKVVNIRKVENSQVNFQSNKYWKLLLKNIFADVYHLQKKFNHLVYNTYHIVENIFLVNGWLTSCLLFVNCLYESQQDNIIADHVNKLLRWLKWFIICKRVVEMFVNNDNILLRISLALLNGGQQVVWLL